MMRRILETARCATAAVAGALAGVATLAGAASGQLANASASTLALAGNHTALAREFAAISVNPAGLGAYGSGFSLALIPVQGRAGLAPITLDDLALYENRLLPGPVKEAWLAEVAAAGGQSSTVGADVTYFALSAGHVGVQLSTVVGASLTMPPDVVEAALYGNAGRTGQAKDLSLLGATMESFAVTTAAMGVGIPVSDLVSLGVTGKYSIGHGVAVGRAFSGALETNPIRAQMEFGLVTPCADEIECTRNVANGGSGLGIDFGAHVDLGDLEVGASLQNVFNTFAWDENALGYRPGTLLAEAPEDTTIFESDFEERAFSEAPADLQELVRGFTFPRTYRFGGALHLNPVLSLTGDVHGELGEDKISLGPRFNAGLGAELRLPVLQLRAGFSRITDGMRYAAGAALVLGPVNLSAAGALERGDTRDGALAQVVLSFGGR